MGGWQVWLHLDPALGNPPCSRIQQGNLLHLPCPPGNPDLSGCCRSVPRAFGHERKPLVPVGTTGWMRSVPFIWREMIAGETFGTSKVLQETRTYLRAPRRCWRPWWEEQPGFLRGSREHTGAQERREKHQLFQTPESPVPAHAAGSLPSHVPSKSPQSRSWRPSRVSLRGFLTKLFGLWLCAHCARPLELLSQPVPGCHCLRQGWHSPGDRQGAGTALQLCWGARGASCV